MESNGTQTAMTTVGADVSDGPRNTSVGADKVCAPTALRRVPSRKDALGGPSDAEKARAFGAKYFPTRQELEYELAHSLPRVQMVRIRPEAVTGKLVHEK